MSGHARAPGRLRQRAQRELGLRREQPERALEARRDAGQDDARVAPEALRAPVHHGLHGLQLGGALLELWGLTQNGKVTIVVM